MNAGSLLIIAVSPEDRRGLFLATANRLGTPLQNVEKDFWVLDLLFNGRDAGEPRLLFKGGTSLSKAYGLISRFSEDIDITVFREDIGLDIEAGDLEEFSGKQQQLRLKATKQACLGYILGSLEATRATNGIRVLMEVGVCYGNTIVPYNHLTHSVATGLSALGAAPRDKHKFPICAP